MRGNEVTHTKTLPFSGSTPFPPPLRPSVATPTPSMTGKKAKGNAQASSSSSSSTTDDALAPTLAPIYTAPADRRRSPSNRPPTNTSPPPITSIINNLKSVADFYSLVTEIKGEVDQLREHFTGLSNYTNSYVKTQNDADQDLSDRSDTIHNKLASHLATHTSTTTTTTGTPRAHPHSAGQAGRNHHGRPDTSRRARKGHRNHQPSGPPA